MGIHHFYLSTPPHRRRPRAFVILSSTVRMSSIGIPAMQSSSLSSHCLAGEPPDKPTTLPLQRIVSTAKVIRIACGALFSKPSKAVFAIDIAVSTCRFARTTSLTPAFRSAPSRDLALTMGSSSTLMVFISLTSLLMDPCKGPSSRTSLVRYSYNHIVRVKYNNQ